MDLQTIYNRLTGNTKKLSRVTLEVFNDIPVRWSCYEIYAFDSRDNKLDCIKDFNIEPYEMQYIVTNLKDSNISKKLSEVY